MRNAGTSTTCAGPLVVERRGLVDRCRRRGRTRPAGTSTASCGTGGPAAAARRGRAAAPRRAAGGWRASSRRAAARAGRPWRRGRRSSSRGRARRAPGRGPRPMNDARLDRRQQRQAGAVGPRVREGVVEPLDSGRQQPRARRVAAADQPELLLLADVREVPDERAHDRAVLGGQLRLVELGQTRSSGPWRARGHGPPRSPRAAAVGSCSGWRSRSLLGSCSCSCSCEGPAGQTWDISSRTTAGPRRRRSSTMRVPGLRPVPASSVSSSTAGTDHVGDDGQGRLQAGGGGSPQGRVAEAVAGCRVPPVGGGRDGAVDVRVDRLDVHPGRRQRGDGGPPPVGQRVEAAQLEPPTQPHGWEQGGQLPPHISGRRHRPLARVGEPVPQGPRAAAVRHRGGLRRDEDHRCLEGALCPRTRRVVVVDRPGTELAEAGPGPLSGRVPTRVAAGEVGRAAAQGGEQRPEALGAAHPVGPLVRVTGLEVDLQGSGRAHHRRPVVTRVAAGGEEALHGGIPLGGVHALRRPQGVAAQQGPAPPLAGQGGTQVPVSWAIATSAEAMSGWGAEETST